MIVGGYTLDLYCNDENAQHRYDEFPHQFAGKNKRECYRDARRAGWMLRRDRTASCPKCSGKVIE